MLEAVEAAQEVAIARRTLIRDALKSGRPVCLSGIEVGDGVEYYFCATEEALKKERVQRFREWLFHEEETSRNGEATGCYGVVIE